eukprot:TRINITY_DN19033_c0_g1::TRINITY_DN19033_c0_g1_i1::g.21563::m.21563 TRINITY_DN19033_c0_g1::TRINITY_DN19033_c0_g1_i1::g.21563  ORF type:complete len:703 (+),score=232.15,UPF0104/PF03706.8/0.91,UPF0104/PF03706.8/91,UPF0104/PF03706.8/4.6e+02,UPF0104/PF03706.8/4.9e+02 TRINITY_DN19033_c0_g1_i1:98-2110(+)
MGGMGGMGGMGAAQEMGDGVAAPKAPSTVVSSSERRLSERLQRLAASSNKHPGLIRLRRMLLLLLVLLSALAIANYVLMRWMLAATQQNLHVIREACDRRYLVTAVSTSVFTLNYVHLGYLPSDIFNTTTELLLETSYDVQTAHRSMFLDHSSMLTDELERLYTEPNVTMQTLKGKGEFCSLWEAGMNFASRGEQVSYYPVGSFGLDNPVVYYVATNGDKDFMRALNASVFMIREHTEDATDTILRAQYAFLTVVLALLVSALLFVIYPIINNIINNKDATLRLFLELPRPIIKRLYARGKLRVERDEDNMEEAEHCELEALELDPTGSLAEAAAKSAPISMRNPRRRASITGIPVVMAGQSKAQAYSLYAWDMLVRQCANYEVWLVFARSSVIVLFTALFFLYLNLYGRTVVNRTVSSLSEVIWSSERQHRVLHMFESLRNSFNVTEGDASESTPFTAFVQDSDMLNQVEVGLLYGDGDMRIEYPAGSMDDQAHLMFDNGCSSKTMDPHQLDGCASSFDGLMTRGVHNALIEYARASLQFLSDTAAVPSSRRTPQWITDQLASDDMQMFEALGGQNGYLQLALEASTEYYIEGSRANVSWFVSLTLTLCACFIVCCALVYVFIYDPLLNQLRGDLHRTRSFIFMLPKEVIDSIPTIRDFILEHSKALGQ